MPLNSRLVCRTLCMSDTIYMIEAYHDDDDDDDDDAGQSQFFGS